MVLQTGESLNPLFEVLSDWNAKLEALNVSALPPILNPNTPDHLEL